MSIAEVYDLTVPRPPLVPPIPPRAPDNMTAFGRICDRSPIGS
jgi:unspecific monooxygenase